MLKVALACLITFHTQLHSVRCHREAQEEAERARQAAADAEAAAAGPPVEEPASEEPAADALDAKASSQRGSSLDVQVAQRFFSFHQNEGFGLLWSVFKRLTDLVRGVPLRGSPVSALGPAGCCHGRSCAVPTSSAQPELSC